MCAPDGMAAKDCGMLLLIRPEWNGKVLMFPGSENHLLPIPLHELPEVLIEKRVAVEMGKRHGRVSSWP